MRDYQSVDDVLKNYMNIEFSINPKRKELIEDYYSRTNRVNDPCFKTVVSDDYMIKDYCDVFVNISKRGTVLALYSEIETLKSSSATLKVGYPMQNMNATAMNYFGLKMNILAMLVPYSVTSLVLFYGDNKSQVFFQKEIVASTLLDHYYQHYKPKVKAELIQEAPKEVNKEVLTFSTDLFK